MSSERDAMVAWIEEQGFRILAPNELDPATVERCAQVTNAKLREFEDIDGPRQSVVAAIRTLTGGNNGR